MRIKMNVALSLMLSTMLTVPLMATRTPKLPSVKIRVAVSKAIRSGEANVLANVLDEHDLHVDSVLLAGGYTVLHEAVVDGSPEIVEYLIRNDAQVNIANEYGHTPLDEATLFDKEEIVTLLEQAGATHGERFIRAAPTAHGIRGEQTDEHTALVSASSVEQSPYRPNRGANIEHRSGDASLTLTESLSNDVSPALADAAWKGDTETVALLLDRGADIEAQGVTGKTALIYAAEFGRIETVALLLDRGANLEAQDVNGSTALMYAAGNGRIETVALLLDRGANQNEIGLTALLLAEQNGHIEIVALLREQHGTDN